MRLQGEVYHHISNNVKMGLSAHVHTMGKNQKLEAEFS